MTSTLAERYPYAHCNQCGWMGRITELVEGSYFLAEACPECGLDDTVWMTSAEYVQELKECGSEEEK